MQTSKQFNLKNIIVIIIIAISSSVLGGVLVYYLVVDDENDTVVANDVATTVTPIVENLEEDTSPSESAVWSSSLEVNLYYKDISADPNVLECNADVFVPGYIEYTGELTIEDKIIKTLDLLFTKQLSQEQIDDGLNSSFPDDDYADRFEQFKLVDVTIVNGVATLIFDDPDYFTSGGSCRVGMMREQIENTVMQFAEIDEVQLEGKDGQYILQP